jgi:hypothetical protein
MRKKFSGNPKLSQKASDKQFNNTERSKIWRSSVEGKTTGIRNYLN